MKLKKLYIGLIVTLSLICLNCIYNACSNINSLRLCNDLFLRNTYTLNIVLDILLFIGLLYSVISISRNNDIRKTYIIFLIYGIVGTINVITTIIIYNKYQGSFNIIRFYTIETIYLIIYIFVVSTYFILMRNNNYYNIYLAIASIILLGFISTYEFINYLINVLSTSLTINYKFISLMPSLISFVIAILFTIFMCLIYLKRSGKMED